MEYELVKVVCQAVVARREDGRIVGEEDAPPRACYSIEEMLSYRQAIEAGVNEQNAQQDGHQELEEVEVE